MIGDAAHEGDVACDLEALGEGENVLARRRGLHVVDPEVERRDLPEPARLGRNRDAARVVEKRRDDAAMHDAGLRIAHKPRVVGNLADDFARLQFHDHEPDRGGVRHARDHVAFLALE